MDGPGTISWEEFLKNAEKLLSISDGIADGWELRGDVATPGQAYLVRKAVDSPADTYATSGSTADDDAGFEDFSLKLSKDPYEASPANEEETRTLFFTEHHILWSMSYGVPVLFFNGWKSDGIEAMSANEAQKIHGSALNYTELSQAIHPILGTPFLQLHPCLSQELLRGMPNSKNKLISWLSCIASAALNLKIHPQYYTLTH